MKIKLLTTSLIIFFCFSSTVSFSQQNKFEFEKINIADFKTILTKDSSAVAEVIADVGRTRFEYGPKGFYLIFERKTRIHILKQEGTSHATIEIPLYKSKTDREQVASFKGYTYNPVSYTHLDVYKRQVLSNVMMLFMCGLPDNTTVNSFFTRKSICASGNVARKQRISGVVSMISPMELNLMMRNLYLEFNTLLLSLLMTS